MLKIEVVKFEAQDVITASVAAAPCMHDTWTVTSWDKAAGVWTIVCDGCGITDVEPIPDDVELPD